MQPKKPIKKETTGYQLKAIPKDVYDIVSDQQNHLKKKFKRNVSMERIIYRLIRYAKLHAEAMNDDKLDSMEAAG